MRARHQVQPLSLSPWSPRARTLWASVSCYGWVVAVDQLMCTEGATQRLGLALAGLGWPRYGSYCTVRLAEPRLLLPSLGRHGVRPTPCFTYRVEALGRCQCRHVWANDLGRRGDGDVPLPCLPPLADAGATCLSLAAPIQARRTKPSPVSSPVRTCSYYSYRSKPPT